MAQTPAQNQYDAELEALSQLTGAERIRAREQFDLKYPNGKPKDTEDLGIKNIHFIKFASLMENIHDFISGIDVYTHARADGEVCSASIIEAMYHGKPVITHPAENMGHMEQIDGCGKMAYSVNEYAEEMRLLKDNKNYYTEKSEKTLIKYKKQYSYYITIVYELSVYGLF